MDRSPGSRFCSRQPALSRGRIRGFTLVELLVVIAIISIIAGFLIPTLIKSRGEADKVDCQNKLREIAKMAIMYADAGSNRFFPFGKGANPAAHESLNVMAQFFDNLKPEIFVCRTWRGPAAQKDDDGKFLLEEQNCSYTWPNSRLAPTDDGYDLSSDKYIKGEGQLNGHELGMNVVSTDTSVHFVLEKDLPGDGSDRLPKGLVR